MSQEIQTGFDNIPTDRQKAIMDMETLGYEFLDGDSEDFLMWKAKNEFGSPFGFDGWQAVNGFIDDVHTLMKTYTVSELQARANGDYSVIGQVFFGDIEVRTAINNHPMLEYAMSQEMHYFIEYQLFSESQKTVLEDMYQRGAGDLEVARFMSRMGVDLREAVLQSGEKVYCHISIAGVDLEAQKQYGTYLDASWQEVSQVCRSLHNNGLLSREFKKLPDAAREQKRSIYEKLMNKRDKVREKAETKEKVAEKENHVKEGRIL